jgi:hypothetical protein
VAGVTKNGAHRARGNSLDNPANTARSAGSRSSQHLPAQHRDLMPQHEHLHRVGLLAACQQDDQM